MVQFLFFLPMIICAFFGALEVASDTSMEFSAADLSGSTSAYFMLLGVIFNFMKGKTFTVVVSADMLLKLMLALERFKVLFMFIVFMFMGPSSCRGEPHPEFHRPHPSRCCSSHPC